ncbi:Aste57867_10877 [Aphanomyces stellatus]|uniref:Aste57867_10877 protein n=1 Tax=Aphanomyces stellatus TaxID=120398 RepID=A0A485KT55_9STRA|nr:hypothetical protein As57867_010837 [Aphanomyces stellatus]VFT87745.1 Aste57867_10877 [Aphanomyces stellatus]
MPGLLSKVKGVFAKHSKQDKSFVQVHKPIPKEAFVDGGSVKKHFQGGAHVNCVFNDGNTPLTYASQMHNVDIINALVASGADRDLPRQDGMTPLLLAIQSGDEAVVNILLAHGANVDKADTDGKTGLLLASEMGDFGLVDVLLARCANVNLADQNGYTPLLVAIKSNHFGVARVLLDHGASVHAANHDGSTPLHFASTNGHVVVAQALVDRGANVNELTKRGNTPLGVASKHGHTDMVEALLVRGAALDLTNNVSRMQHGNFLTSSKHGETPLALAAEAGHVDVARLLLDKGADPTIKDNDGKTTLNKASSLVVNLLEQRAKSLNHASTPPQDANQEQKDANTSLLDACATGRIDLVTMLLAQGADVNFADDDGMTALMCASHQNHARVASTLLEHGAKVNQVDKDGSTALLNAIAHGHVNVVINLLACGANVDLGNLDNDTPLRRASRDGYAEIVDALLGHGAQLDTASQFCARDGTTPLMLASEEGHVDVVESLLKHGAKANVTCKNGYTSLLFAIISGHTDTVKTLLAHGANADTGDNLGRTPLWNASEAGHVDLVNLLLVHGATVDLATKEGNTPLAVASKNGHVHVVRVLIVHGRAKLDSINKGGKTPLVLAAEASHADVVKVLLDAGAGATIHDNAGKSALDLASKGGHFETMVQQHAMNKAGSDILPATQPNREATDMNVAREDVSIIGISSTAINTQLLHASSVGQVEHVRSLLAQGAEVNYADVDGMTGLLHAIQGGHNEVATTLINHGANVDVANKEGNTPLFFAIKHEQMQIALLLLQHGVNIDVADKSGNTPLLCAIKSGRFSTVNALLKHGANLHLVDSDGVGPLDIASQIGIIEIVNALVVRGAAADMRGNIPLVVASKAGHADIVQLLLVHGATIDFKNKDGETALVSAAKEGHEEVVQVLLDAGADATIQDTAGKSPLDWASERGQFNIVTMLQHHTAHIATSMTHPATPPIGEVSGRNEEGQTESTPDESMNAINIQLLNASTAGRFERVRSLLAQGADVNYADADGMTAFLHAIQGGHIEIATTLINHGANVDVANKEGNTSLFLAIEARRIDIVMLLLQHGINVPPLVSRTAIHHYCVQSNRVVLPSQMPYSSTGPTCTSSTPYDGAGPLVIASMNGNLALANSLLERGAACDMATKHGDVSIGVASQAGHSNIVALLVRHGAQVDWTNNDGETPLTLAGEGGHADVVQVLLDAGADAAIRDKTGQTVVDKAMGRGHSAVVTLLQQHGNVAKPQVTPTTPRLVDSVVPIVPEEAAQPIPLDVEVGENDGTLQATSPRIVENKPATCLVETDMPPSKTAVGAVTSLEELTQHILADTSKQWPLFHTYELCPDLVGSSTHSIFRAKDTKKPMKTLVVKLTDGLHEKQFFDSVNAMIPDASKRFVECLDAESISLAGFNCVALIMEGGVKNASMDIHEIVGEELELFKCVKHVLEGLTKLHRLNYIHGDVKLENVVDFGKAGYKLIDFDHAVKIGSLMTTHCTEQYCPPEMAHLILDHTSQLVANVAFDVWCVAVLILKLFSPSQTLKEFMAVDTHDIVATIASPAFSFRASVHATDLSPGKKENLLKCLHVDPVQRGSIHDLQYLLPDHISNTKSPKSLNEEDVKRNEDAARRNEEAVKRTEEAARRNEEAARRTEEAARRNDDLLQKVHNGVKQNGALAAEAVDLIQKTRDTVVESTQVVIQAIFDATEVTVPTSFIILPYNIHATKNDDSTSPEQVVKQVAGFYNKLHGASSSLIAAAKAKNPVAAAKAVIDSLVLGKPMYFYLVDDVTESVVDVDANGVYPIQIDTKTKQYTKFMTANWPRFQQGFQVLKGANTVAGLLKSLGVPTLSDDMLASVEKLMNVKASSVEEFDVVQAALENAQEGNGKQVNDARGPALRELVRFFDEKDPKRTFAGLSRVPSETGRAIWTKVTKE